MKSPFGGFRKWRHPNILHHSTSRLKRANLYSDKQYHLYQKNLLQLELKNLFNHDSSEDLSIDQLVIHINEIIRERIEVVQSSYKIANRSKGTLPKIYQWAYSFKEKDQFLLSKLNDLK